MFATWILCIFFVLIAPYLLVEAAVLRTRKCAQLGAPRGYRSELARSSQTAWDYAQKLCSMRYMLGGIVMGDCGAGDSLRPAHRNHLQPVSLYAGRRSV